jgi:hypothetical protein
MVIAGAYRLSHDSRTALLRGRLPNGRPVGGPPALRPSTATALAADSTLGLLRAQIARLQSHISQHPAASMHVIVVAEHGDSQRVSLGDYLALRETDLARIERTAPSVRSNSAARRDIAVGDSSAPSEDPLEPPAIQGATVLLGGAPAEVDVNTYWTSLTVFTADHHTTVDASMTGTTYPSMSFSDSWTGLMGGPNIPHQTGMTSFFPLNVPKCANLTGSTSHHIKSWWSGENSAGSVDSYTADADCSGTCGDYDATNFGEPGDCVYPDTCLDPDAENFLEDGTCVYPPPESDLCDDPSADNYGSPGSCDYSPPPDYGGGGGGTDPCDIDIWDVCDPAEVLSRIGPMLNAPVMDRVASPKSGKQSAPYDLVLVDNWDDPTKLAVVSRYRHGNDFVDAIFLPAFHSSGTSWSLAVRALQRDRAASGVGHERSRTITISSDGSTTYLRNGVAPVALRSWQPFSEATASALNARYARGPCRALAKAERHNVDGLGSVRSTRVLR